MLKVILFFAVFLSLGTSAKVREIQLQLDQKMSSPRWMYDSSTPLPKAGVAGQLAKMKRSQRDGKWKSCYLQGNKIKKLAQGVRFWVLKAQMECLENWAHASPKAQSYLQSVLNEIENKGYLQDLSIQKALLSQYLVSYILLLKKKVKANRSRGWKIVLRLQKWKPHLSNTQLADIYFLAGEMAFLEQKMSAAYDFFNRSLSHRNRKDVAQRLKVIERTAPYLRTTPQIPPQVGVADEKLKYTEDELKIKNRMDTSKKSKDFVSFVEDGVQLIEKFPGSDHAKWAEDEILSIFLGSIKKTDEKFELYRSKILRSMKKADAQRLLRWARNAYVRNSYLDALTLCEVALQKLSPHPDEKKLLLLAANSALHADRKKLASSYYEKLIQSHAGSLQAHEAVFRIGLINYRSKNYSKAAFYFEKLLASEPDSDFHAESMYWKWQAYKKLNKENSEDAAKQLMDRYPLTYYGLRARSDLNKGKIIWKEGDKNEKGSFFENTPLKLRMNFTEFENQSYERFLLLLSAGWFQEAQYELKLFPKPLSPSQKVAHAFLWSKSTNHFKAIKLMNEVWDEDEAFRTRQSVEMIFPFEYREIVVLQAKKFGVDPNLVKALIRQESSFRPEAVSSSNAYGLMQIIPLTARDIVKYLKIKRPLKLPEDLFDVRRNVHFGSSYISRMIRAFDGHVPLALAAYNAGIGRVRKWLKSRSDLVIPRNQPTSNPDHEIWMDEMPWSETRDYVKATLRNYLIYELIENGQIQVRDPVWKISAD